MIFFHVYFSGHVTLSFLFLYNVNYVFIFSPPNSQFSIPTPIIFPLLLPRLSHPLPPNTLPMKWKHVLVKHYRKGHAMFHSLGFGFDVFMRCEGARMRVKARKTQEKDRREGSWHWWLSKRPRRQRVVVSRRTRRRRVWGGVTSIVGDEPPNAQSTTTSFGGKWC